ncbi:MAG: 3,4-dihydroxy-2-butanone-4-phosphate synthase [Gammaproteobacteria bacterium]|uniref:bifunctional 3,4-dihydroxy-2-butanone-4-phosphate synthase/GTP cyclohydrolase II n=1 Tax=Pseudomaricurvus alcaniphilus TaxID=1166482 RepID=UPI0014086408|nr:bifunctional 3,4-dihydroxy-2-butanone-4-phosphate synthase/GTP cyclohydrolase II [Pseudomaricurvus alcaniphilus]MBR9912704.1 3,4-dihydroxy-2-butanone-4-phosphate synthase [Gammaproteobacteria bacterium]NHN38918.1 3,4-dihydroxy-2-butanone-4-phosphate synthase [Pseudomaricurvus alcaniphilus]
MKLNSVKELIDDIRQGKMVILMDDEDRENEGDLVMAAEQVRPEDINFMATHARGLICLTLSPDRCKKLDLPLMVNDNMAQHSTNFTVSIEAAEGVTTGISAADRARTVRAAVARDAKPSDIVQPGHIFPLMAEPGGVLSRAGHTEAGCDLARLAGFEPAAVIVEIMNSDGTMARRPDLEEFAKLHDLKIGTIADLIHYRSVNEKTVSCIQDRKIKTQYGEFTLLTYLDKPRQEKHFALIMGDVRNGEPPLVRVHVGSMARDVLRVRRDLDEEFAPWTLDRALQMVADEGRGVIVMICHTESPTDVEDSIDWMLSGKQERPSQDLVYKQVGTGSQILKDLGVGKMRLMSAPFRFNAISGFELEVVEYISNRA